MSELPKIVTILSAPRSGSSALSRMIARFGINFGASSELLPPSDQNKYGFYELQNILDLNEKLISLSLNYRVPDILQGIGFKETDAFVYANSYWMAASRPLNKEMEISGNIEDEMENLVQELGSVGKLAAIKDARLSVTLPIWSRFFQPVPIIIWRHPAQVARSLERMSGLPTSIGEQSWFNYTMSALENCSHLNPLIISHDDLIGDPERIARQLYQYLAEYMEIDESDIDAAVAAIDVSEVHQAEKESPKNSNVAKLLVWLEEGEYSNLPKLPEESSCIDYAPFMISTRNLYRRLKTIDANMEKWQQRNQELTAKNQELRRELEKIRRIPGYSLARSMYRLIFRK